ncbi:acyl-CoA-binding protein [Robbsia sp. KACC 23696]|uniref:acyl-CoA-binding protein n=1 Tax=Robbsia sp. KACC 23696 TaxID=3149231 RepID=UPI00325AE850
MADQPQSPLPTAAAAQATDTEAAAAFALAQERVKTLSAKPGPIHLLRLYSLYKQATVGDATGERPGMTDFAGRAKFDAWAMLRGTPADAAMRAYAAAVDELLAADA